MRNDDELIEQGSGGSVRLFQIKEDDLAALEHLLPQLAEDLTLVMTGPAAPRLRVQIRQVKEILSNVRWNYGPPSNVTIIPCEP